MHIVRRLQETPLVLADIMTCQAIAPQHGRPQKRCRCRIEPAHVSSKDCAWESPASLRADSFLVGSGGRAYDIHGRPQQQLVHVKRGGGPPRRHEVPQRGAAPHHVAKRLPAQLPRILVPNRLDESKELLRCIQ